MLLNASEKRMEVHPWQAQEGLTWLPCQQAGKTAGKDRGEEADFHTPKVLKQKWALYIFENASL